MTSALDRLRRTAAVCAFVVPIGASCAVAADASRWDGDARSAVRLIAGSSAHGEMRAGIEIRLKAGWHTYWRYPGEAGVPPRFEFAGSQNLKAVEILWPAPQRLLEGGLVAIGYVRDVILPLAVVPQDRAKPVKLRLRLDYAVCEKLCVPAEGKVELTLTGRSSPMDDTLADAEARVPKRRALGEGSMLAIHSLRREEGSDPTRIIVDVAAPAHTSVALFVEGPSPGWALPVPVATERTRTGLQSFAFALEGAPPGARYSGASLTLTAVAGETAIEVTAPLD